ncbi:hypothetical protein JHK85_040262 [Glycine max]|nr:hypothetical protein JHK85_040262 [Glycine max]
MPASPSENQTRWRKRKRDSQISRRHQKHEEEEEEEDDDDDDENPNGATRMIKRSMNRPHSSVTAFVALERALESGENKARSALEHKPPPSSNEKKLEAELVNVTGTAKPTRKIRSEQDKEPEQEAVLEVVGPGPSEESGNDATKWSERKEAVVDLTKLASTKRISPGDFSEVCRTLKKFLTKVHSCSFPYFALVAFEAGEILRLLFYVLASPIAALLYYFIFALFHPPDEELVAYYLKRQINGRKIELEIISEVDLYKCEPWDLPDSKSHGDAKYSEPFANGEKQM